MGTSKSKTKASSLVKSKKTNAWSPCKSKATAWKLARARQNHGHQQEQGKCMDISKNKATALSLGRAR